MEVVVQVSPDVAPAVRGGTPSTEPSREIFDAAAELGVVLDPMDPGSAESPLADYFVVMVADPDLAQDIATRFQRCQAIEAAYVKPPAELP